MYWQRVEQVFSAVLEAPPNERVAQLDALCGSDANLRAHVSRLLKSDGRVGSGFLEPGVVMPPPSPHTSAGAERLAIQDRPGTAIGPYTLHEQIGEGGFGVVYLAEQHKPVRRRVALKIIKPGMDTRQVVARFQAERQALALMDHPNIAHVLDGGETDSGRPYFVMELVKGIPITEYCDQCGLTTRQRLELFLPVCQAVQHAHQKGIIHRDLKPSNVMIAMQDGQPAPKVIDFGVAKAINQRLTEHTLYTQFAQMVGTPLYMSPEQAEMSPLEVDTRSDIYSLGALLYELLTGTTPFERERLKDASFDELRRIIRQEDPPQPSTRLSTLGERAGVVAHHRRSDPRRLHQLVRGDLDWIVMRALEKDRTRRYETANGFAADVQRYLVDEPVQARPPSVGYRWRKFVRRHKVGAALAAAFVLLVTVSSVVSTVLWRRAAAAEIEQSRERERAEAALAREEAQRALAERREKTTGRVAEFQASMLRGIDAERMGRTLLEELHKQIQSGLERIQIVGEDGKTRTRTPEEIKTALKQFDAVAGSINPADVANQMMDIGVLAPAAAAVEANLADEPEVLATLFTTLGRAYFSLGQFERAEPLFRRALDLRRRVHGEVHTDVAGSLIDLGQSVSGQGNYAASEQLFGEALAMNRKLRGDEHPDVAWGLTNLANSLRLQGAYAAAESLYRDALAMNRKLLKEDDPFLANSLDDLASILQDKGDYAEAEALLREALAHYHSRLGAEHRDVAICLYKLALLLHAKGDHSAGEAVAREALAISRKVLGDEHPHVAFSLNVLAGLLAAQEDYAEAEPLLREALTLNRRLEGEHPSTAATLHNLADMLHDKGDDDDAEPLFRESLALRRKLLGNQHLLTAQVLHHLAETLHGSDNFEEAEKLAAEAVDIYRGHPGWHPVELFHALSILAAIHEVSGHAPEAARIWHEALDAQRSLTPELLHPDLAPWLTRLGLALLRNREYVDAEPVLRESLRIQRQAYPDGNPEAWRRHQAASLLGDALAGRAAALAETDSQSAVNLFAQAEPLLLEAYAGLCDEQRAPAPDAAGLDLRHDALERVVYLYEAWHAAQPSQDYAARAAEWRAELEERQRGNVSTEEDAASP